MTQENIEEQQSTKLHCPSFSTYLSGIYSLRKHVKEHGLSFETLFYGVNEQGAFISEDLGGDFLLSKGVFDCAWALNVEKDTAGKFKKYHNLNHEAALRYAENLLFYTIQKNISFSSLFQVKEFNLAVQTMFDDLFNLDDAKKIGAKTQILLSDNNVVGQTRRELGLTQDELSRLLREPRTNIYRWERGHSQKISPHVSTYCSLLRKWFNEFGGDKKKLIAHVLAIHKKERGIK